MGIHEPCQVRKEAALSGRSHVPQGCLGRANCLSNAYGRMSTEGARQYIYACTQKLISNYGMSFFTYILKNGN